jgi:hypothetical protein
VLRLPLTITAQQFAVGLATFAVLKTHRREILYSPSFLERCLNHTNYNRRTKEREQKDKAGDHLFEVKLMSVGGER